MAKGRKNIVNELSVEAVAPVDLINKAVSFLRTHEYVEKIYINKEGDYHLQSVEGFTEYLSVDLLNKVVNDSDEEDTVDYVLTEEDFINNPDFEKQGLKVGDTVQIPAK